jgi:hypothetical protein
MVQTLEERREKREERREKREERRETEKREERREKREDTYIILLPLTSYILPLLSSLFSLPSQRHHHPCSYRFITGKGDS